MLRNAKSFHNKYFSSSPPDDPTTTTTSMNSHLLVAWEAKKEVELLRETVESMFRDFGDTLQEVLNERQPSDDEMSEQTEENLESSKFCGMRSAALNNLRMTNQLCGIKILEVGMLQAGRREMLVGEGK